jgi:drug/metabolite transporter (DMT)-like permease
VQAAEYRSIDVMPTPPSHDRATHTRGIVLVTLSTVTWGTGGLFVRLMPFDLGTIVFWRGVFGTLFVAAFIVARYRQEAVRLFRSMGRSGVVLSLFPTATVILFTAGVQLTSIANAFTILAALPFFSAAIAWVWIGERPSSLTLGASAIALVGIVIMFRPGAGGPNLGDVLAVLGTISQGIMTVAIRRNPKVEVMPIACLSVFISVIVALPLAHDLFALAPRDYAIAALYGLVVVALGMMLYMMGSALIPATLSALIGVLEAPIGALWAWAGVGEVPATTTIIGGGIVVASVAGRLLVEQLTAPPVRR